MGYTAPGPLQDRLDGTMTIGSCWVVYCKPFDSNNEKNQETCWISQKVFMSIKLKSSITQDRLNISSNLVKFHACEKIWIL